MAKKVKIKKLLPKKTLKIIFEIVSAYDDVSVSIFTAEKKMIFCHNKSFPLDYWSPTGDYQLNDWHINQLPLDDLDTIFVATLVSKTENSSEISQMILSVIANLVTAEIDKKQLLSETLDRYHELNVLYSISEEMMHEFELVSLIKILLRESVKVVKAKEALLFLTKSGDGQIDLDWTKKWKTFDCAITDISGKIRQQLDACLKNNRIEILEHLELEDFKCDKNLDISTAVIVPLASKEEKIGLLIVFDRGTRKGFNSSDMKVLNAIATQGVMAIQNSRLVEKIKIEERRRTTLQRYFSPNIANIIINNIDILNTKGEKTVASVLFSDIRDFTKISNSLEPEVVVQMLNEYFSVMSSVIFKYNGTLDKYIGDAIMAEFGMPISSGNDTYNAVKAGLEMLEELKKLNDDWQKRGMVTFEIGISLNTGYVISGNVGSTETINFTVIGDTVNLASRLEKLNKEFHTSFLISEFTHQHVKNKFDFKFYGKRYIRGIAEPVGVYEVLKEK